MCQDMFRMPSETLVMKREESSNSFRTFCVIDTMLHVHLPQHRYLYPNEVRQTFRRTPISVGQMSPESCSVSWREPNSPRWGRGLVPGPASVFLMMLPLPRSWLCEQP